MKSHYRVFAIVALLLITGVMGVRAQFNMLFTSDFGLPNSLVNSMTEDEDGMLWIATEHGMSRFDGARFTNIYRKNGEGQLASNFVRTVFSGGKDYIIVATVLGVQIYNKRTDTFSPIIKTESIDIPTSNINDICKLKNGDFAIAGFETFNLHIEKDGSTRIYRNSGSGKSHNIFKIMEDSHGNIWTTHMSYGVRMNGNLVKDEKGGNYNFITVCESKGTLYGGHTESGLYRFNPRTKHFSLITGTEDLKKIRSIKPIKTHNNHNVLCIAMDGMGIRFFDTDKNIFVPLSKYEDPFIDLSSQKAHALHVNREGDVWIALYQKGIYLLTSNVERFGYIGHRSEKYNIIGNRCVNSIMQAHDGTVWVTTDNGGLYGMTKDGQPLRTYPITYGANGIPATILGLFEDSRHRVWFGSFGLGGGIVDLSTGRCSYVPMDGVGSNVLSVYEYVEDKRGNIWAVTMGNGIIKYDETAKKFTSCLDDESIRWSDCIYYDKKHDVIYAGTYNGVVAIDARGRKISKNPILAGNLVYSICRISETRIGLCATEGIAIYDTDRKKVVETFGTNCGLPTSNVLAAKTDQFGNIWVSTTSGLSRIDLKTRNTETYTIMDGIQGNEFYRNAAMTDDSGNLWFGGLNGISIVKPDEMQRLRHTTCIVRVVRIKCEEKDVACDTDGNYTLPSSGNTFSIYLAARPIQLSHHLSFNYRLDDGQWDVLPVGQSNVSFNKLPYGKHILYTKTIVDGKDSEITETEIYIAYPWYMKWWMVIVWIALVSGIIVMLYRLRMNSIRLSMKMEKHRQEEELQAAKMQFFMNIVHDLRTPLSLIVTPLDKLMKTDTDEGRQRQYDTMKRNATRLVQLSNEIMDLRRLRQGKIRLQCDLIPVGSFLVDTVNSLSDMADVQHQELIIKDNIDRNKKVCLDTIIVENIVVNLLSNAIKYTGVDGKITVEWSFLEETKQLKICITDNGIGIKDEDKKRIFERFYQVRETVNSINGAGIGLNIVSEMVQLHHGQITVEDNPEEQGSRFTVLFPADASAYSKDEMKEEQRMDEGEGTEDEGNADSIGLSKRKLRKRHTIVVADDNPDILNLLDEELSDRYNIIGCKNGKEAFDIINKDKVDLLITDIIMPEIDGLELCRMIRHNVRLSHLPIILLSAKASDYDKIEGMQAAADAYITKPFNFQLLNSIVSNLLTRHDMLLTSMKGYDLPTDKIETPEVVSADEKLMERLLKVINENLSNPNLTSDFLAQEVGLSRIHLYRKLKELTNQSATTYIRNIRLAKAAEMLKSKKTNISEVSYMVGFRTPSHFSTAFKEFYGVSPKDYCNSAS